ncbi:hypothetical protein ABZX40_21420 [Streptomyces sp. NPDC004610]|uniref:hypothetical protein n=1 Tax=unclassified Streptomyces TaxID=2593676 RepID=UPI0033AA7A94
MSEQDVDARVEELNRELRRLAGELLLAAADHPDPGRARTLSAAARELTGTVLARLDGQPVEDSARPETNAEAPEVQDVPDVQDTVPPVRAGAPDSRPALGELVERYASDFNGIGEDNPVMIDPELRSDQWARLHRVRFGKGEHFAGAPLWNDTVPDRGRKARRLTTGPAVLRRLHRTYVTLRDLETPEGELALRFLRGSHGIQYSRGITEGGFVGRGHLNRKLTELEWRAVVTAAERGEHAQARILELLRQLEVLAAPVLALDVAFRQRNDSVDRGMRVAGSAEVVKSLLRNWPPPESGDEDTTG